MAQYVTPEINIIDKPDGKNNFFVRLAYGYVEHRLGMDTKKMTTRQVIQEFLDAQGASTPKQFFEKEFKGKKSASVDVSTQENYRYDERTERIFDDFRKSRGKKRHEEAVVVDNEGRVISDKRGDSGSVSYTPSEYKHFKGALMIHNHPQANTFLSDGDIHFFYDCDLRYLEATGYDGTKCYIYVDDYMEMPNREEYDNYDKFVLDYEKWLSQRQRIKAFMMAYQRALTEGIAEARKKWEEAPKAKIKTGRYFVSAPEGWDVYTKGASPRDRMNFPKYAEIIQKHIIEFSKSTKERYGITCKIERAKNE